MAKATVIEVEDKPTQLVGPDSAAVTQGQVILRNEGTETVDLGGSTVATGAGFKLLKESNFGPINVKTTLHAVAASGKKVKVAVLSV